MSLSLSLSNNVTANATDNKSMSFNDYFDLSPLDSPAEHLAMQSAIFSDISSSNRPGSNSVSPFEDFDHTPYLESERHHMNGPAQDQAALVHHRGPRPGHVDHQHTGSHNHNNTNSKNIGNNNTNNNNNSIEFFPSTEGDRIPVNIVSNNNTFGTNINDFDFLDTLPANYKWDLPEGDMTWDIVPDKQQLQALIVQPTDAGNTPELSPETMNLCTPGVELINSPYAFDNVGLDEISSYSPSVAPWESPFEESFGSNSSVSNSQSLSEAFDYDFNVQDGNMWQQQDFQLFPDEPASIRASALLHSPVEAPLTVAPQDSIYDSPVVELKHSPVEYSLGGSFSTADTILNSHPTRMNPASAKSAQTIPVSRVAPRKMAQSNHASPSKRRFHPFAAAKMLGKDVQAPSGRVAPRKPTQSPTKVGFQPAKRPRRRRITSEEASRIIPEGSENDPNVRPRYRCNQCDKTFTRPFNLRSHRATHEGLKPHECTFIDAKGVKCHWTFARRHDLDRHMRSRHSPEKMFQCRTCGIQCGRSDAFKRHLARTAACSEGAVFDDDEEYDEDQDMDQCLACRKAEKAEQSQQN